MARIVVLGAGGRLGAALARDYAAHHEVLAWGRQDADLSQPDRVADMVRNAEPDMVINSAAMTNVDECEKERAKSELINAMAPGAIAEAASEVGARLIHISTDYVFSGEKIAPYGEEADLLRAVAWFIVERDR